jgi:hypothetical protein
MDEDEKFFDKSVENIDWSTVIRGEPMDVPTNFDLESALTGKQHSKTVQSWIENYDMKKIFDFGSGKVYVRDANGIFTVDTASDAFTDF